MDDTRIHHSGTVEPMSSAVATTEHTARLARQLENRRARRLGSVKLARLSIARETGVAAGTLENLRRSRIKQVAAWVRDRIAAAIVKELEAEAAALEHELQLLRQQGSDPREIEIDAVVASLDAVRKALRK